MNYVSLQDELIYVSWNNGEEKTYSPDMDGVRILWNDFQRQTDRHMMFSSTVDFPEDAGLPDDFNLGSMLEKMSEEEEKNDVLLIFKTIDKLVEEGNIQELARRAKKLVLSQCTHEFKELDLD